MYTFSHTQSTIWATSISLYRAYTFSTDEVIITDLNENSNGELEMTIYAHMNDATAVLPKDTLKNAVQVMLLPAWTNV